MSNASVEDDLARMQKELNQRAANRAPVFTALSDAEGKRGQIQFAGTARRVLRTNWTCAPFSTS